jgi:hypothetical protein
MPPKEDDNADAEEGALLDSGPTDADASGPPDEQAPPAPADAEEDDGLKTVKRKRAPVDKDAEDKRLQEARNKQVRLWTTTLQRSVHGLPPQHLAMNIPCPLTPHGCNADAEVGSQR